MSGQSDETVDSAGSTDDGLLEEHGIDRRSLIKKAGIAGAAVWAAPMVLDSVLSPASAASLPPGDYKLRLSTQQCNPTPVLDPSVPPPCPPPDWPAATLSITSATQLANFGLQVLNCNRRYALSVHSTKANVTFLSGSACKTPLAGGAPVPGVVSNGGLDIEWAHVALDRVGYFIVVHVV
jgi:hypothetical protein